jgi:hypothetical protein
MRHAHARFDVHDRFFAALDAVLEILAVAGAAEDVHPAARNHVLFCLILGVGALAVAQGYGQLAFVAMIDCAVARLNFGGRLARLRPDQRAMLLPALTQLGMIQGNTGSYDFRAMVAHYGNGALTVQAPLGNYIDGGGKPREVTPERA